MKSIYQEDPLKLNKKISLTLLQTTSYDATKIIKRWSKIAFTHIMKQIKPVREQVKFRP